MAHTHLASANGVLHARDALRRLAARGRYPVAAAELEREVESIRDEAGARRGSSGKSARWWELDDLGRNNDASRSRAPRPRSPPPIRRYLNPCSRFAALAHGVVMEWLTG